jgi:osmoprotectant transport system ATP-binding protein
VLWVTHDLHEAATLADDILLMRGGKLVQRGTLSDLVEHPADPFVSHFIRAQHGPRPGAAR